jgi:predicted component of type VI protein secretion system
VRDLVGCGLDVDVRLVLDARTVPAARLGASRLARTSWLARPPHRPDADDMLMRTVAGYRAEPMGAAA